MFNHGIVIIQILACILEGHFPQLTGYGEQVLASGLGLAKDRSLLFHFKLELIRFTSVVGKITQNLGLSSYG